MRRTHLLTLMAIALFGCKPQQVANMQGYILGDQNDIKPLTGSDREAIPEDVVNAAVLIATQVEKGQLKFCSGSLVGPKPGETNLRVLTNHHCFANVNTKGQIDANWIPVACINTTVYMGFSVNSTQEDLTIIKCKENTLRSDVDGDVAIFTLAENPPEKYKPLKVKEVQETGEVPAFILHYPDVASNYKTIPGTSVRLPAASITALNCMTKGKFATREWHLDKSLPYSLKHTCDLVQGSSGSALINAETYEILGVNWGGIKINYAHGTELTNVATGSDFVNAFLNDDVEGMKVTARQNQNSSDAEQATAEVNRSDKDSNSVAARVKKVACGEIGQNAGNTWSTLLLMITLLLPVSMNFLVTKREN